MPVRRSASRSPANAASRERALHPELCVFQAEGGSSNERGSRVLTPANVLCPPERQHVARNRRYPSGSRQLVDTHRQDSVSPFDHVRRQVWVAHGGMARCGEIERYEQLAVGPARLVLLRLHADKQNTETLQPYVH